MEGFSDGSSTLPASTKTKGHPKGCPFVLAATAEGGLRPSVIQMLGMAEPSLRRGFASGKTPVRRIGAAGQMAGWVVLLYLFEISKYRF